MLVFDIETDGLLEDFTKVHCLVILDTSTDQITHYVGSDIYKGVLRLTQTEQISGHNIIDFDLPVLSKTYGVTFDPSKVLDTFVAAKILWPKDSIFDKDKTRAAAGKLPATLIGSHKLEAWGYRLGNYKGDFKGPWNILTDEMLNYCYQDVRVTGQFLKLINSRMSDWGISQECFDLEMTTSWIVSETSRNGFAFDTEKAILLHINLSGERDKLTVELADLFPPWFTYKPFIPKRDNASKGYKAGEVFMKPTEVMFNPNSRDHIAYCLTNKYGWKPTVFTPSGKAKIDEDVLGQLNYPEAKSLCTLFTLNKRISQLATGEESWIKHCRNGLIHGRINNPAAVTYRMTHSSPNMAQVPASYSPWGKECRELFGNTLGTLVGIDADALELRCLAARMALYDGGAYIKTVLEGNKADGTDMHTLNAKALGCDRDTAKTWFYAFIYGAGVEKLGYILLGNRVLAAKILGAKSREAFLKSLPALEKLINSVKKKSEEHKYLKSLHGGRIFCRSSHSALNTLLQCDGAVLMKRALVIFYYDLLSSGLEIGKDFKFVANVHDEWQVDCKKEHAEFIGKLGVNSIKKAGEFYNYACPLTGNYNIGSNWKETH